MRASKEMERDKEKGMLVGVFWSCVDMKLLLTSLLFLCSLATIVQLLPSRVGLSSQSLLSCLYSPPPAAAALESPAATSALESPALNTSTNTTAVDANPAATPNYSLFEQEKVVNGSTVKRALNPIGSAAYLFVQMGAYRGGVNTFAVVGLASKPLHVYAKPEFRCEWRPFANESDSVVVSGYKILPDWGYGRVYTVVVVNCTFPADVGADGSGGHLVIHATTGGGVDAAVEKEERFLALEEAPGAVNTTLFTAPPRYDYLYCGSPLYGDLSPQRVREWMAYHVRLFGGRSHFVIYDGGGVHPGVMEVLRPWIEKKMVTLQDIREEERFDGYYHNQFLVVNDCLHRYKHMAKWVFFFDLDEFIYVEPRTNLRSLLDSLTGYTQFTIEQRPMSSKLCLSADSGKTGRMWGFEKLIYRDAKRGIRRDRKYAIQPRNAFATGVHMSQNIIGKSQHGEYRIKYFHYHGTIAHRGEPCQEFTNATHLTADSGTPFVLDNTLRRIATSVKRFEHKMIGSRLSRTWQ